MANNRIFYAAQRVEMSPDGSYTTVAIHGVQSVGINTSFNLQQVSELGQLELYENIEGIPNVEVTIQKVLDGYCPAYLLATKTAPSPTLSGRSAEKCLVHLGIWPDTTTTTQASNVASRVEMSGMFPSSISYSFGVDGPFTEDITLVGQNIIWAASYGDAPAVGDVTFDSTWAASDSPFSLNGSGGVNLKENLIFGVTNTGLGQVLNLDANGVIRHPHVCVFPSQIPGITSSGINPLGTDGNFGAHLQSVTCASNYGREELFELGRRAAYFRYINFPVECTTEITCYSISGLMISANEAGVYAGTTGQYCTDRYNLLNQTIRIATCEGLRIYMGKKNKLSSMSLNGGDAAGGNALATYSFSNFNDFTVMHMNDAAVGLRPTGQTAFTYLSPS